MVLFLPFFAILSSASFVSLIFFPFKESVRNDSLYGDDAAVDISFFVLFTILGVISFLHRPMGRIHKWVRIGSMVLAVLMMLLTILIIWTPPPD